MIKICDFGIARKWERENSDEMTKIGTPNYMAPELLKLERGSKRVNLSFKCSAFIYLLKVMLIKQSTGKTLAAFIF